MTPIEGPRVGSIASAVRLFQEISRPEGQCPTKPSKSSRMDSSSVLATSLQTVPFGSQNRAPTQSCLASVSARSGPSYSTACSAYGTRAASDSEPSKPTRKWLSSQNGLF